MDVAVNTALRQLFMRLRYNFDQELIALRSSEPRNQPSGSELEVRVKRNLCAEALRELRVWYAPSKHFEGDDVARHHWTTIKLYSAAGSGLCSTWDAARGYAVEYPPDQNMASAADVTAEHLRALAELRESDECANWYTDEELAGTGPRREDIDWTDFPIDAGRT